MSAAVLVSLEEYLNTSYSPDREYLDGELVERNVGNRSHSILQGMLTHYLVARRKRWRIEVYPELRIRVRKGWYAIPDVCVYQLPAPEEDVPERPPLLWIEILSPDDRMLQVLKKAAALVECGVPYVWIINPNTLDSELWTAAGRSLVADKTLSLPDTPIVIPLHDVMAE
jgi:Uma2 family endonuclease